MTDKNKKNRGGDESHIAAIFMPRAKNKGPSNQNFNTHQKDFEKDFLKMLGGQGEGLMTIYLFDDLPGEKEEETPGPRPEKNIKQTRFGRAYGGSAWSDHVKESSGKDEKNENVYKFPGEDIRAQKYALENGLLNNLPGSMKLVEYGSGGLESVMKPAQFIQAALDKNLHIQGYVGIDILDRFAIESAQEIHKKFNLAAAAVEADFMRNKSIGIPDFKGEKNKKDKPGSVAMIYGGPIANAPLIKDGVRKTPQDNATAYLAKMNKQYGQGSYLLMTYHTLNDGARLIQEYSPTERDSSFESFVLSAFVRAVEEGVITDSSYNPFEYWEMDVGYDQDNMAVKLNARCKKAHTIPTTGGDIKIEKGQTINQILSHKWNEAQYAAILNKAGYTVQHFYRAPGSDRGLVLAKATRTPQTP